MFNKLTSPSSLFGANVDEKIALSVLSDHFNGIPEKVSDVKLGHVFSAKQESDVYPSFFRLSERKNPYSQFDGQKKHLVVQSAFDPNFSRSIEEKFHWVEILKNHLRLRQIDYQTLTQVRKQQEEIASKAILNLKASDVVEKSKIKTLTTSPIVVRSNEKDQNLHEETTFDDKDLSSNEERESPLKEQPNDLCLNDQQNTIIDQVIVEILSPAVYIDKFLEKRSSPNLRERFPNLMMNYGILCSEVERRFNLYSPLISIASEYFQKNKDDREIYPVIFPPNYYYGNATILSIVMSHMVHDLELFVGKTSQDQNRDNCLFISDNIHRSDCLELMLYQIVNAMSCSNEIDFSIWEADLKLMPYERGGVDKMFQLLKHLTPSFSELFDDCLSYAYKTSSRKRNFFIEESGICLKQFSIEASCHVLIARIANLSVSMKYSLFEKAKKYI